jgi:hypothetical protein
VYEYQQIEGKWRPFPALNFAMLGPKDIFERILLFRMPFARECKTGQTTYEPNVERSVAIAGK